MCGGVIATMTLTKCMNVSVDIYLYARCPWRPEDYIKSPGNDLQTAVSCHFGAGTLC